jgi:hypothetical protein
VALPLFLESFVPLAFHFFKQLLIVRQPLIMNDFADFSLHASSNHSIDGILLALNSLLRFPMTVTMDLGVKG